MRFEQLDLNLLVAFDTLLNEQSITKAADKLNLSQPATSCILGRLRDYFQDDLLVQIGRRMQPTPFAIELHEPVKQMLGILRTSITNKRVIDPTSSSRHFRIIASDYTIKVYLAAALREIERIAPLLTFEFLTPFTADADILAQGGADFMIAPEIVSYEGYPSIPFSNDELVCIADVNNQEVGDELTIEKFTDSGHVSIGFARISRLSIESWLNSSKRIQRRIEIITNDFSTIGNLVVGSRRLATIPRKFAAQQMEHLPIKILKLPFNTPELREHMFWHPTLDSDPLHAWLRNKIKDFI